MNYEVENYSLYVNWYYTSINALINIKKYNIYSIVTILKNRTRKYYNNFKDIKLLNKREYKFYKNKDQLLLTVWKDKKDVFILTNFQNTIISTKKEKIKIKDDSKDLNISKNIIKYEDNEFTLTYIIKEYIEKYGRSW